MSEAERLRRLEYKQNRKKWILIQTVALVVVFAIALAFFAIYDRMNRTYYIEYTENGEVDYKVNLKDNSFFDEDYVEKGHSYVSSLIKNVTADFTISNYNGICSNPAIVGNLRSTLSLSAIFHANGNACTDVDVPTQNRIRMNYNTAKMTDIKSFANTCSCRNLDLSFV